MYRTQKYYFGVIRGHSFCQSNVKMVCRRLCRCALLTCPARLSGATDWRRSTFPTKSRTESTARSAAQSFTARHRSTICRRAVPATSLPPHRGRRRAVLERSRRTKLISKRRHRAAAAASSATEPMATALNKSRGDSHRRPNDSRRQEVSTFHRWKATTLSLPPLLDTFRRRPIVSAFRFNDGVCQAVDRDVQYWLGTRPHDDTSTTSNNAVLSWTWMHADGTIDECSDENCFWPTRPQDSWRCWFLTY